MSDRSANKERHTSTVKVTQDILDAISRATEYYGNVSTLAKMMGVAHSTIIFWRTGKTASISGRLWVARIRPVLEPFLPSSKVNISDTPGQYVPQFPVIQPYVDTTKKVEKHEVNVIPVSLLRNYDPALESASVFIRARCSEKRTFYHECRRSAFALKIDSLFTDVFPENSYILAYPDGLQNGCFVICKLQGSTEILARKYTKIGNIINLTVLPGGTGETIVWDCEQEIGRLAWCFPLVELNLDLLPSMKLSLYEAEDDDAAGQDPSCDVAKQMSDSPRKRGRKRKNAPIQND